MIRLYIGTLITEREVFIYAISHISVFISAFDHRRTGSNQHLFAGHWPVKEKETMISWIIALWNWSPVVTISLYLGIGYFVAGIMIRFSQEIDNLLPCKFITSGPKLNYKDFLATMMIWLIILIILLLAGAGWQTYKIIRSAIRWGTRGFRPPPVEPPNP
jgi:hypothetical protein